MRTAVLVGRNLLHPPHHARVDHPAHPFVDDGFQGLFPGRIQLAGFDEVGSKLGAGGELFTLWPSVNGFLIWTGEFGAAGAVAGFAWDGCVHRHYFTRLLMGSQ